MYVFSVATSDTSHTLRALFQPLIISDFIFETTHIIMTPVIILHSNTASINSDALHLRLKSRLSLNETIRLSENNIPTCLQMKTHLFTFCGCSVSSVKTCCLSLFYIITNRISSQFQVNVINIFALLDQHLFSELVIPT